MSSRIKIGLWVYGAFSVTSFTWATYNDGKSALLIHRTNARPFGDTTLTTNEWDAVKNGCIDNMVVNFCTAALPFGFLTNIMPSVVIYMNPETAYQSKY